MLASTFFNRPYPAEVRYQKTQALFSSFPLELSGSNSSSPEATASM
jgi:hypothetical protein